MFILYYCYILGWYILFFFFLIRFYCTQTRTQYERDACRVFIPEAFLNGNTYIYYRILPSEYYKSIVYIYIYIDINLSTAVGILFVCCTLFFTNCYYYVLPYVN